MSSKGRFKQSRNARFGYAIRSHAWTVHVQREGFNRTDTSVWTMKSILIADGDERIAHMFAEVFASHDWRVTRYSDGHRAGEALSGSAHYDAVLVGYRFEGMDGVELITRIRRLAHRQDVPIVMVTGTVDCAVAGAALAAGADDVLYKPTDVAIVVTTVTKCVERRGRQDT